jgi:hypothetical protein
MVLRRLAKQPRRRTEGGRDEVVRGLEPAIEALKDIQRLQSLELGGSLVASRLESVIKRLRQKGVSAKLPLLVSLAEALEDAQILAMDTRESAES